MIQKNEQKHADIHTRLKDTIACVNANRPSQLVLQKRVTKGCFEQAERTGFEPADQLPGHGFSKPALSTTQPPLRGGE